MARTATLNLADKLKTRLPAELADLVQAAGEIAGRRGENLYLVGGAVRDLLLGRTNLDLDLVVEGDAINLANELTRVFWSKMITHTRFGTAKVQGDKWSIDIATARSETYARPGALPTVTPGAVKDDLFRRDFTINTMAIELSPACYGQLLDLYGGRDDLERKLIRILHERSFIDDATRIWRAVRYEQRLDFSMEPVTLGLLRRDIDYLDTISGDRIRHELELVLKEEYPEKAIRRAGELGVLARVHPGLKADDWLAEKFAHARRIAPEPPPVGLDLALLAYRLTTEEVEQMVAYLRLPKTVAQTLRDTISLKTKLNLLTKPGIRPGAVYALLHDFSPAAITANSVATDSPTVREHLNLYSSKLRHVRTVLTGSDLRKMGIAPGIRMKELLTRLLDARLNGRIKDRSGEEQLVKKWLGGGG